MSNYLLDGYHGETAAQAPESERVAFIRRTYLHLAVSVAALVGLEFILFKSGVANDILKVWFESKFSLLIVFALFIGGGLLAQMMARASMPAPVKYLALAGYTCLQAVFLLPILYVAMVRTGGGLDMINQAAVMTLVTFGGLTLTVFLTKMDFSFLRAGLVAVSWAAFAVIIGGIIFDFGLGIWFSFLMVASSGILPSR